VQTDLSQDLAVKTFYTGELLRRMRGIPTAGNGVTINGFDETSRVDGSRFGGVQAHWADEAGTATATKPKFRQLKIKLKKLLGFGYTTSDLLQDSPALGAALTLAFVNEFRFRIENDSLFGNGGGKLLGIINSGALCTVDKQTGQGAGTVVAENITKMYARMWGPSRSRGLWLVNQEIEPSLIGLTVPGSASHFPLYVPTEDPDNQPYNLMLGRPVLPVEYAKAPGELGDILFVDMGEYMISQKESGISSDVSMHVNFLVEEEVFRFVWRIDGQPMWSAPVTPANGSNTLSPYVALAARS
jgi:HK97 family phage major capsid protein